MFDCACAVLSLKNDLMISHNVHINMFFFAVWMRLWLYVVKPEDRVNNFPQCSHEWFLSCMNAHVLCQGLNLVVKPVIGVYSLLLDTVYSFSAVWMCMCRFISKDRVNDFPQYSHEYGLILSCMCLYSSLKNEWMISPTVHNSTCIKFHPGMNAYIDSSSLKT